MKTTEKLNEDEDSNKKEKGFESDMTERGNEVRRDASLDDVTEEA